MGFDTFEINLVGTFLPSFVGGIIDDQGPVHNSTTILAKQSGYTNIRSEANLIKISILASTCFGVAHLLLEPENF